jgi:hypothetical protein
VPSNVKSCLATSISQLSNNDSNVGRIVGTGINAVNFCEVVSDPDEKAK